MIAKAYITMHIHMMLSADGDDNGTTPGLDTAMSHFHHALRLYKLALTTGETTASGMF